MSLFEGCRDKVKWDGFNLSGYFNLYIVDINKNESSILGVNRKVNFTSNGMFLNCEDEVFEVDITFVKTDYNGSAIEWYHGYIEEVTRLLFEHKEPKILEVGNKCYYGMFTGGNINKINKSGYFTVTFQSVSPYSFGSIIVDSYRAYKEKESDYITLDNIGVTTIYADMKIKCIEDGKLMLKHCSNNGYEITVNMIKGQEVYIIGDTKEIIGNIDVEGDLNVLQLRYGVNRIKASTDGVFDLKFNYQPEFPLI